MDAEISASRNLTASICFAARALIFLMHPKCGASWEGYAVEETLKLLEPEEAYFWRTHQGAELDLLLFKKGRRFGVEIKRADAPSVTPSMRIALTDLRLEHLAVIYPGVSGYSLANRISVIPMSVLAGGDPRVLMRPSRHG
jgi:hypothetical protein